MSRPVRPVTCLTPQMFRALSIIKHHGPVQPKAFAHAMWPQSPSWGQRTACGPNGVSIGLCMAISAGGYLGKLAKRGMIRPNFRFSVHAGYVLTELGQSLLDAERSRDSARPRRRPAGRRGDAKTSPQH